MTTYPDAVRVECTCLGAQVANYSKLKQTPIDTIKHKKKLREWFEVRH